MFAVLRNPALSVDILSVIQKFENAVRTKKGEITLETAVTLHALYNVIY